MTVEDIKRICQIYDNFRAERDAATIAYNSEDTFWEHVLATYNLSQPYNISNLDEAAEEYAWKEELPLYDGERLSLCFKPRVNAFKAGAKWMAEQGVSTIAISSTKDGITEEGIKLIADYLGSLPDKTKVILQIRKK